MQKVHLSWPNREDHLHHEEDQDCSRDVRVKPCSQEKGQGRCKKQWGPLLLKETFPVCLFPLLFHLPLSSLRKKSVQFSRSVISDSLWPHELQHARPSCPSPTPGAYPNSCPLSWWCHPTILSSVIPFSSCLQSFPASGSFPMSQFFSSASALASISPSNKYSGLISFRIDWFDLLAVQGTLKHLLQDHSSKASILRRSAFFTVHFFTSLWCCA